MIEIFNNLKKQIVGYGGCLHGAIDFHCKAILDSACLIDDAFRKMIDGENFYMAAALIRMHIDNALVAWSGLICQDGNDFIARFMTENVYKKLDISWEMLNAYGITKDMMKKDGKECKEKYITASFAHQTLNFKCPGVSEIYKRACTYIHPTISIIEASWKGDKPNTLVYKDWKDVKPWNYDESELEKDYVDSCHVLIWVMSQWLSIKRHNADSINNAMLDPSNIEEDVSPEIRAKMEESLKLFHHNGKKDSNKPI